MRRGRAGRGASRAAAAAALTAILLGGPPLPALAQGPPQPLGLDFSGDGVVTDAGSFGVAGAAVEVALWGTSGIASGPEALSAGPAGGYNWSFPQVSGSLSNLTLRAWLPWDPNVSSVQVFDLSNGTNRTIYNGVNLSLPFNATESVALVAPSSDLILPRGREVNASFAVRNTGNVAVAHAGFGLTASLANVTVVGPGAGGNLSEERPGAIFGFNASFRAPASAGIENGTVTAVVASGSGANFSLPVTLRVVPARDAALLNITTNPAPPDEARPGELRVLVFNAGTDPAPATDVRVRVFNATLPNLYANSTQVDLSPGASTLVSFGWTPPWSPEGLTAVATATAPFDFDPSNDTLVAAFPVNATNQPPHVTFSTPAEGARLAGNVTIVGRADDPEGGNVTLAFSIDAGTAFLNTSGPAFAFVWDLTALPDGPHTLVARAVDERGLATAAALHITVLNRGPNAPPTVSLDNPRDGDLVGELTLFHGTASDERSELSAIFLSVDGGAEVAANGAAAWNLTWNATAWGPGPHQVRVRAFDGIDYSAPVWVNLTVDLMPPSSLRLAGLALSPSPAIPGATVVLNGTAAFDTGVLAGGAAVGAQVRQFPGLVSATSDERGRFSLDLTAPATAGTYAVDLAAELAGLRGNASLSLAVSTSTLPDLALLSSSFAITPDPPPANTAIHHSIEVVNNGTAPANATLRVWDGPRGAGPLIYEWRFSIVSTRQAGFDHAYTPGTHNLTFAVEDVDPQEANPADNTLVVSVPVEDAPDFKVESIAPSTNAIVAGSNITFLVVVLNEASASGIVEVEIWDGPTGQTGSTLIHGEQVGIRGGERERVLGVWTPTAGEHRIFAYAYIPYNPDAETDRTDNELNITVNVSEGAPAPAPTPFLPGFGGAGAAAAAAAAAASGAGRRGEQRRRRLRGEAKGALLGGLLVAALCAALLPGPGAASIEDAGHMPGPLNGVCQACHVNPDGGGPLNAFGADYWAERNASGGSVNWTRLGALDSDRDGFSNSDEWNGSYLPGDNASNPRTGVQYGGFTAGGISGLLTGALALVAVSAAGVWLGFVMLKRRNERRARKAAAAAQAAASGPQPEEAVTPPAPKP